MPSLGDRFRVVQNAETGEIADSVFHATVHDRGLTRVRLDGWPTTERSLAALGEGLIVQTSEGRSGGVWERDGAVVRIGLGGGWFHVQAAADDAAAIDAAVAGLRALFPMPDPSSSHEVPVTFWTYTPHGPMPSVRTIAVPEWDEIAANYAARTREKLESIMHGFRPAHGGQLVLWHGKAGTGKTFALRGLEIAHDRVEADTRLGCVVAPDLVPLGHRDRPQRRHRAVRRVRPERDRHVVTGDRLRGREQLA